MTTEQERIYNREYMRKYRKLPYVKEKMKIFYKNWATKNKEKIRRQNKQYQITNKVKLKEQKRKHRMKPEIKKQRLEYNQKYYAKPEIKKHNREYFRKYNSSIERKLSLHHYMLIARNLKKYNLKKPCSTKFLIDYLIQELKEHLEKQFSPEMNWKNYGEYWEIDHKIPRCWFHYKSTKDKAFKRCWSLENLQPLKKEINHSKLHYYADITPFHFRFLEEKN
jgi:hypothetical protein